jgi:hypothetical protein
MRKYILLIVLYLSATASNTWGQDLLTNNGGLITINPEAKVYVYGSVNNKLNGPDDAILENKQDGLLFLTGNYTNSGTLNAHVASTIRIVNETAPKNVVTQSGPGAKRMGKLHITVTELELAASSTNNLIIQPGGEIFFEGAATRNVIRTHDNDVVMETSPTLAATFRGHEAAAVPATGSAPIDRNYINTNHNDGFVRWQTTNTAKQVFEFPVGEDASAQYLKLEMLPSALTAASIRTIICNFRNGTLETGTGCYNSTAHVFGTWRYDAWSDDNATVPVNTLAGSDNYTLVYHPRTLGDPHDIYIANIKHNGENAYLESGATNGCDVQATPWLMTVPNLKKFTRVSVATGDNPLSFNPELRFAVMPQQQSILLRWANPSEEGVRSYTIERSTDGTQFAAIQQGIQPQGGRNPAYTYTDKSVVLNQPYFYRIRQQMNNGTERVSNTLEAMINGQIQVAQSVQVYPNPFNNELQVYLQLLQAQNVKLEITDLNGKTIAAQGFDLNAGPHILSLINGLDQLTSGVYALRVHGQDFNFSQPIVRQ